MKKMKQFQCQSNTVQATKSEYRILNAMKKPTVEIEQDVNELATKGFKIIGANCNFLIFMEREIVVVTPTITENDFRKTSEEIQKK